jgi:hypothetical protein
MNALNSLNRKYKNALINFGKISNKAKQKDKHVYIYPLRSAGLTLKQAHELGFKVSLHLWGSCIDQSVRNKGNSFFLNQNN